MKTFDPYGLPPEICQPTHPLIGMAGLAVDKKASHRLVWEAFAVNRQSDRIPLNFKLYNSISAIELPQMKPKRQSYEWYIPKGILKSNWVKKYVTELPSLIVLFADLDWNDSQWNDKKTEISSQIQILRSSIDKRNTRLAVVLIQSSLSVTLPGEDTGAAEKAATLCATCELPPKHLFVLPHSDAHLLGYTIRLENALSEISGLFYSGEAKSVKAHRDFLNKTNHQLLFIRHQFKLGFHNQMRGDPQTAIKHYSTCYHHLIEHRFTNTNLHEIRIVAGIVNYKICRLNFVLNLPRDSIEQFRRHLELFKQRTGPKELIFEHYAWLSKQYEVFGQIFDEAVREGLPAVQTQHPGFYYQQAALFAVQRRESSLQVCKETSASEELLKGWEDLEFYGQRPWRPGKHLLEPPEMQSEAEGIKALSFHERYRVNCSELTIPLFSAAMTQFKKYKCPRIKRYLMVQIAKEYAFAFEPSKSLTLMNHVMWDYRSEGWWTLLSSCSQPALSFAYQTGAVKEYCSIAFEILGPNIRLEDAVKDRVFDNIQKVMKFESPDPDADLSAETVATANDLWDTWVQGGVNPTVGEMNNVTSCLRVSASFSSATSAVDQNLEILVKIRNSFYKDLSAFSLSVGTTSISCPHVSSIEVCAGLLLKPHQVVEISLAFQPLISDLMNTIRITDITLGIGISKCQLIHLQWLGGGAEEVAASQNKEFRLKSDAFDAAPLLETQILSRSPLMDIELSYDATCMVWEWLPIKVQLTNQEATNVEDISLSLGLEEGADYNLDRTTQVSEFSGLENKLISSSVTNKDNMGPLPPWGSISATFYIKTLTAAKRSLALKVKYNCRIELVQHAVVCPSVCVKTFSITSTIPFQITVETQSLKFDPVTQVAKNERFLVVPKIKCCSHVPITFTDSSLALTSQATCEGENLSLMTGEVLREGEEGTDCFCVAVKSSAEDSSVGLGQYLLYWKRSDSECPTVSVSVGLPTVAVEDYGLWVEAEVPPQGAVRAPMTIAYELTNKSTHLSEVVVTMHVSDAFMFSGHKELRLRMLPGWKESVTYTLFPLLAGFVQLPKLCVNFDPPLQGGAAPFDAFLTRILPSHVFIMPQEKKMAATETQII